MQYSHTSQGRGGKSLSQAGVERPKSRKLLVHETTALTPASEVHENRKLMKNSKKKNGGVIIQDILYSKIALSVDRVSQERTILQILQFEK